MSKKNYLHTLSKGAAPSAMNIMEGVNECVKAATDYLKVKEHEQTRRAEISKDRDVAIAAIQSQKEILLSIVEKTYGERYMTIKGCFDALDKAVERGDIQTINTSLTTIVNVVNINPLEQIKKVSDALSNTGSVLRLE